MNENNKKSPNDWESEMSKRIAESLNKLENKDSELLAVLEETSRQKKVSQKPKEIPELSEPEESAVIPEQEPHIINDIPETIETPEISEIPKPEPEKITPVAENLPPLKPLRKASEVRKNIPEIPADSPTPVSAPVKKKKKKKKKSFKKYILGFFPQKGDSMLEKCRKIIYLASIITIIICGTIVLDYYIDTTTTQNKYEDIMGDYQENTDNLQESPEDTDKTVRRHYDMMSNAAALYNINPDVVGVISIPDTDVFYPVVKGRDNIEYLNKTVTGEEARAGSVFIDYRNVFDEVKDGVMQESSDNIIIYGHEMATGKMFGSLKMYKDNTYYYEEHPIIEFNSNYYCYKYKIFSIMIIDADDTTDTRYEYWNTLDFENEKEFYDFVNEAKRRNIRLNDVDLKYGDKIITLSTCNEIFGKEREGRLVIMARRLRDGEDPLAGTQNSSTNPNIKWPSLYYEYNNVERFKEEDFIPYG